MALIYGEDIGPIVDVREVWKLAALDCYKHHIHYSREGWLPFAPVQDILLYRYHDVKLLFLPVGWILWDIWTTRQRDCIKTQRSTNCCRPPCGDHSDSWFVHILYLDADFACTFKALHF